jgi:hypothetical protein
MRRKIRQIDDFFASRINSTTVLPEKLRMGNLDGVIQMIRAEVRSLSLASQTTSLPTLARQVDAANGEPVDIVFDKEDFVNAFKTLPIRAEDQPLFVTTWGGADARRQALQLLSMPFGATASVHGWERFAVGLQMVMVRPLVPLPACASPAPHFAFRRPSCSFWVLADTSMTYFGLAGARCAANRLGWPAQSSSSCSAGSLTALSEWSVNHVRRSWGSWWNGFLMPGLWDGAAPPTRANVCARRHCSSECVTRPKSGLQRSPRLRSTESSGVCTFPSVQVLQAGWLSPASAGKLAGKVSWAAAEVFGRAARVWLSAVYKHATGRAVPCPLQHILHRAERCSRAGVAPRSLIGCAGFCSGGRNFCLPRPCESCA